MIRACLTLAAAAVLIPAAHAQDPCSLLTPDQIKAVINSPVEPGQPGVAKGSNECTWGDADGNDRVYIALRPATDFRTFRSRIEKNGLQSTPVSGLGQDAFFVSPDESSSALYVLTKTHLLILTVNGPNATLDHNQAFARRLAAKLLPQL